MHAKPHATHDVRSHATVRRATRYGSFGTPSSPGGWSMLFHITQTHAPADCPYGKGGSGTLYDRQADGVTVLGFWLAFPQHTTYFVVEADSTESLQAFLRPGTAKC